MRADARKRGLVFLYRRALRACFGARRSTATLDRARTMGLLFNLFGFRRKERDEAGHRSPVTSH
jgi:hypothetical protein